MIAICVANYFGNFGIFGGFAKEGLVVGGIIAGIAILGFGPTVEELEQFRRDRRK